MTEQFGITIEAGPDVDSGCDVARIKAPSTPATDRPSRRAASRLHIM